MSRFPRTLFARWLSRRARRRSMGFLLKKPDDRLIEDIGLSRDDLHRLLDALDPPEKEGAARRPPLAAVPNCAGSASR